MNSMFMLFVLVSVVAGDGTYPACKTIQPKTVDFRKLVALSPFNIYSTNMGIYNCTKMAFTGPAENYKYTGSAIMIRGNYTFSYDLNFVNGSIVESTLCPNGDKVNYNIVVSNLVSDKEASVCILVCAENGVDYGGFACAGRSEKDNAYTKRFVDENMPGVPGIYNAQDNCPKRNNCKFFIN